jgi:hypothetical protein
MQCKKGLFLCELWRLRLYLGVSNKNVCVLRTNRLNSCPKPPNWKPVAVPCPVSLYGKHLILEPLDGELHAADLWDGVQGHDKV